jgi:Flp pilus assembly protein TadD
MIVRDNLIKALFKKGLWDDVIKELIEAIRLYPDNPVLHNNLGIAYVQKGLFDNAINEFEEALRLDPKNSMANTNLENAIKIKVAK